MPFIVIRSKFIDRFLYLGQEGANVVRVFQQVDIAKSHRIAACSQNVAIHPAFVDVDGRPC